MDGIERLRVLCEQASKEENTDRLIELVREINRLLDVQRSRVDNTENGSTFSPLESQ